MMFQKIFPNLTIKQWIVDYFNNVRVLADVDVNDLLIDAIEYHLIKTINLYGDFEMLYDEKYTLDNVEYIIISNIPEIASCLIQNDMITSTIFMTYTNMKESYTSESKSSDSYQGFNANSNYANNTNTNINTQHNPLKSVLMMSVEFKNVLNIIKKEIEKLLQTIY